VLPGLIYHHTSVYWFQPSPGLKAGCCAPGFAEWIRTHQNEAMLGGAGIVVAVALYVKSRASSSTSSTSSSGAQNAAAMQQAGVVYPGSGSDSGALLGLEDILAAQQQNYQSATSGASTATTGAGSSITAQQATQALADVQAGGASAYANAGPTNDFMFWNNASQELGQPYFLPSGQVVQQVQGTPSS